MSATITDKFNAVRTGTANPTATTVASARSIGGTTLSCVDLSNWPTTTTSAVHFITYSKKSDGSIDRSTQCDWKGIVSSNTIGSLTLKNGTDAGNSVGQFVEMAPTAAYGQDLYDGLAVSHENDGTLKASIVTTAKINDAAVTTAKIADAAVTNAKLSTATGEIGAAWQSWTPTWTNLTVGNSTVVANYIKIGKTVRFRLSLTLGSTGSVGSNPIFTLPVASVSSYVANMPIGSLILTNGTLKNFAPLTWASTTTANVTYTQADGTYLAVGGPISTVPFTWATGHQVLVCGEYEAA